MWASRLGKVDAHDHPARARVADLLEAGLLEDLPRSDMEFAPRDLPAGLGQHRVPLERSSAPFAGEVDGRSGKVIRQAATPVSFAYGKAGYRPDAGVVSIFVAA